MNKKIITLLLSIMVLAAGLFNVTSAKAQSVAGNLIANSSLEVANSDGNQPLGWQQGKWGENQAVFNYSKTGRGSSRSVKVTITNYSSGDAKWFFSPIAVTANSKYAFSDYYKSSTSSEVVVRFIDAQNNDSYLWLGTLGPSSDWQKSDFNFQTPASIKSLTVLHLIGSVGYLETDDFNLQKSISAVITNNVPNNSFEQTTIGNKPLGWQKSSWGSNAAIFSYLGTGHNAVHSAKVQITSFTDGDAKWYYDPQPMAPGDYLFTDYYQSNVNTQVVVMIIKNDDSISYMSLKNAPASSPWAKYSDSFTLPSDTKQISVFHLLAAVGYLITDDYGVTPYKIQGFSQSLVSITFDDGEQDNITTAIPILKQYGFNSTYYFNAQEVATAEDKNIVKEIYDAGNEIGSHSVTHPHLPLLTATQLTQELSNSKSFLEGIVGQGNVTSFATPYGEYNSKVITAIKKYYQSHRSVDVGFNAKNNFDPYNIRVQNMTSATTIEEFTSWINKAKQDKTWLVIVYHRVAENPTTYDTTPQNFAAQMKVISDFGISAKTITEAINEITSQF